MVHENCIAGRKEYFRRKRAEFVETWVTDENGIVHIPLANGFEAVIFEHRKELASNFLWRLKRHTRTVCKYYAEAHATEEFREQFGRFASLHRVILGVGKGVEVDHKDGNGLNCLDTNLRIATRSQNASNRHYVNSTGYRGVALRPKCITRPFMAQIDYGGKNHNLGSFATAVEAAARYNAEAIRIFGEFAILNQIPEWEPESNHEPGGSGNDLCIQTH